MYYLVRMGGVAINNTSRKKFRLKSLVSAVLLPMQVLCIQNTSVLSQI